MGLFWVALATTMYEILLTRIFSVTMWYHFAFMAISIAMFGMTVGSIIVYLFPNYFTQKRAYFHLVLSSLLFSVSIVLCFSVYLCIPSFFYGSNIVRLISITTTYIVISIPFIFSGTCVCLALTKFPQQVSRLYAADLIGAATGCILLILTLNIVDGPSAIIVVALLVSIGTIFFAMDARFKVMKHIAIILALLFVSIVFINFFLVTKHRIPLLRLQWVKGKREAPPLYEKWNSFSRVIVYNDSLTQKPFGWGISSTYPSDQKPGNCG